MVEQHLEVSRTARYYQLGAPGNDLKQVWFVCHGYGQLAAYFIKNFEILDDGTKLIIAPEGLSRFYLNGFSGRVGATWMTKEDRLHEIEDYVKYLDRVYDRVFSDLDRATVNVFVLGFSQGTAAASRWVAQGKVKAEHLILWAGLLPAELAEPESGKVFRNIKVSLIVGKKDEFANLAVIAEQETFLKSSDISYQLRRFDGGHELHAKTLRDLNRD